MQLLLPKPLLRLTVSFPLPGPQRNPPQSTQSEPRSHGGPWGRQGLPAALLPAGQGQEGLGTIVESPRRASQPAIPFLSPDPPAVLVALDELAPQGNLKSHRGNQ